ncbi:hypothetical protein LPB85_20510 [Chryseobacterium sp. LC2016-27]|jgi:hypothetical protein|uniref:hypothetical protein n=1 Tax=Chryseobacterium sp. LC2016-27 TaxID=2897326 RepID=UPI001E39257A|nr:hypothetical protein [Chryseobacterium sp. LC2016-27]MCD0457818.1 hypothetical protein [Chryseobacterium sp. LC2016-27]
MKKLIFTLMFVLPIFYFAQEEKSKESPTAKECDLPKGFKEPIKNNRLKKFVAIDNRVDEKEVTIIRAQNGFGSGIYTVCVKRQPIQYQKMGTVFMREGKNPFNNAK